MWWLIRMWEASHQFDYLTSVDQISVISFQFVSGSRHTSWLTFVVRWCKTLWLAKSSWQRTFVCSNSTKYKCCFTEKGACKCTYMNDNAFCVICIWIEYNNLKISQESTWVRQVFWISNHDRVSHSRRLCETCLLSSEFIHSGSYLFPTCLQPNGSDLRAGRYACEFCYLKLLDPQLWMRRIVPTAICRKV